MRRRWLLIVVAALGVGLGCKDEQLGPVPSGTKPSSETSAAVTARTSTVRPGEGPLLLRQIHPSFAKAGEGFNKQADGSSAIAAECSNATRSTVIIMDGQPLATTFGGPDLLSALVAPDLISKPGVHDIQLVDGERKSMILKLSVTP